MRRINKRIPLASFTAFKMQNPGATWDDFHNLAQNVFVDSRLQILINEQEGFCGYTELLINDEHECHLDHFRKKSIFPALTFDWNNLIASQNDDDFGARYKDNVYSIQASDYPNILNPVSDNVENYFYYSENGDIMPKSGLSPSDIAKAELTISVFNLKHKSLRQRRGTIIKQIRNCIGISSTEIRRIFAYSGFKSVVFQYT